MHPLFSPCKLIFSTIWGTLHARNSNKKKKEAPAPFNFVSVCFEKAKKKPFKWAGTLLNPILASNVDVCNPWALCPDFVARLYLSKIRHFLLFPLYTLNCLRNKGKPLTCRILPPNNTNPHTIKRKFLLADVTCTDDFFKIIFMIG